MKNFYSISVVFFLYWVVPTIVFYHLPTPARVTSFQLNLILFLFIGIYLLLASSLSYTVIQAVFRERAKILSLCGGAVVALFVLLVILNRFGHYSLVLVGSLTAVLLFGATLLGTVLSSAIKRIGELVPVCCTAAAADIMSVTAGPTKDMIVDISNYYKDGMVESPPLVDFILIKAGIPGFDIALPLFGVADWILVVLLSAALLRLGKSDNVLPAGRNRGKFLFLPVSVLGLYTSLVLARIVGTFIPAMVVISLVFLVYLVFRYKVFAEIRKSDVVYSILLPFCVGLVLRIFSG